MSRTVDGRPAMSVLWNTTQFTRVRGGGEPEGRVGGSALVVASVPALRSPGTPLSLLVRAVCARVPVRTSVTRTALRGRVTTSVLTGVKEWVNSGGGGCVLTLLVLLIGALVPAVLNGVQGCLLA